MVHIYHKFDEIAASNLSETEKNTEIQKIVDSVNDELDIIGYPETTDDNF